MRLQTLSDFPVRRRKQLAMIAPNINMAISDGCWYDWDYLGVLERSGRIGVFSPLRPWLQETILRLRRKHGLWRQADSEPVQNDAVIGFWKKSRLAKT